MLQTTLTTGQTSGFTKIPAVTLRRYVHNYYEFFGESARKKTKGRRFTEQDIKTLLLIRHLYFENCSTEKIRAALRGDWIPAAKEQYDTIDTINLVEAARQHMQAAKKSASEAKWAAYNESKTALKKAFEIMEEYKKERLLTKARIDDLENTVKHLVSQISLLSQQQKKRGFFDFLG